MLLKGKCNFKNKYQSPFANLKEGYYKWYDLKIHVAKNGQIKSIKYS